jgi:hypothetical protein
LEGLWELLKSLWERLRTPLTYLKGHPMPVLVGCFMPFLALGSCRIRHELDGPEHGPAYVLVNGLTQYAELWGAYRDALVARGLRVATFDLLGQGASDKPALFISQDDQVAALALLIDQLGDALIQIKASCLVRSTFGYAPASASDFGVSNESRLRGRSGRQDPQRRNRDGRWVHGGGNAGASAGRTGQAKEIRALHHQQ